MKAFVSWSSGKDCCYALYKHLQEYPDSELSLLNMVEQGGERSRSHGISTELVRRQAHCMGLPLLQQQTARGRYEHDLKAAVHQLMQEQGVEYGIFGDIYLEEHRVWIERVAAEIGITPLFPLWGADTRSLMRGFVEEGFRAVMVALRHDLLPEALLGTTLDADFVEHYQSDADIDVCGENGEYHTFVYDGPLFRTPVPYTLGGTWADARHQYVELL